MYSPRKYGRTGASREFSTAPTLLLMHRNQAETPTAAKRHIRPTASLATEPPAAAGKVAQLRMILFLRLSAIRDCARSSSPGGLNWEHRTGGEMYPESPCLIRKSPT